jgi:hypothetical protein
MAVVVKVVLAASSRTVTRRYCLSAKHRPSEQRPGRHYTRFRKPTINGMSIPCKRKRPGFHQNPGSIVEIGLTEYQLSGRAVGDAGISAHAFGLGRNFRIRRIRPKNIKLKAEGVGAYRRFVTATPELSSVTSRSPAMARLPENVKG